jgi:hypothetical protein
MGGRRGEEEEEEEERRRRRRGRQRGLSLAGQSGGQIGERGEEEAVDLLLHTNDTNSSCASASCSPPRLRH